METYLPLDPLLLSISDFGHPAPLETPSLALSFDYSEWIHPGPSNPTPPPLESASAQVWNGPQAMDGSWARRAPSPFPPFENAPGPLSTSFDAGSTSSTSSRMPSFGSLIPFDNTLPSPVFPPAPFHSLSAPEPDPSLPLSPLRTQTPSRPIAPKASRSLFSTVGPSPSLSTAPAPDKTPRTPQVDESVPEAALHLLRLALPSASTTTGSVATNTTFGDNDASCDEDAEGESDATSLDSDGERGAKHVAAWNYGAGSALIPMGLGRRTSVSSVGSRRRQHRPAREMSVSTRAGSEDRSGSVVAGGRRMSARVRKTVLPSGVRMDYASEEEANEMEQDDSISEEDDDASAKKRGGPSKAGKGKGKAPKPRHLKKRTFGGVSRASPSKKPRTTPDPPPRRIRRTAPPVTSPNRSFPPELEIHPSFPRLYRAFPLSSAFPPDSYVHRHVPLSAAALASTSALPPKAEDEIPFLELPRGEGAQWNKSCDPFNLYAARFVKGKLEDKAGACPICMESVERGGEGEVKWLKVRLPRLPSPAQG